MSLPEPGLNIRLILNAQGNPEVSLLFNLSLEPGQLGFCVGTVAKCVDHFIEATRGAIGSMDPEDPEAPEKFEAGMRQGRSSGGRSIIRASARRDEDGDEGREGREPC